VASLEELLPERARVLDLACGYGRVTVPLAVDGYAVSGIDLSPDLIGAARNRAQEAGVEIDFRIGSMTGLPYADASFDAVVCLWSSFHELLEEDEQTAVLRELRRVLAPGGFGLIEGFPFQHATAEEIATGTRRGPGHRIAWIHVEGILNPHYCHDARSFTQVARAAGVEAFRVFDREWGGRRRLFLRIDRPAAG
jgi:SAM-dependent methyltransferase